MYIAFSVQQGMLNRPTDHRRTDYLLPQQQSCTSAKRDFRERELIHLMFDDSDRQDNYTWLLTNIPTSLCPL